MKNSAWQNERGGQVLFHALDRNPSNPGLTVWFMHLHGLVPVSLRSKIPEFRLGWTAIFDAVQCAMASGAWRGCVEVDRVRRRDPIGAWRRLLRRCG